MTCASPLSMSYFFNRFLFRASEVIASGNNSGDGSGEHSGETFTGPRN